MLIFGRRERHEVISILVEVTRCLSVAGRVRCINSKVAQGWRRQSSGMEETELYIARDIKIMKRKQTLCINIALGSLH